MTLNWGKVQAMSQRFNAPPGWQVPEGFVPPTGWQPDPSWPPAPAGWNFWIDDAAPADAAAGGYGDPSGYGAGPSHAPGSANAALAQTQMKAHKRTMLIGFGILAAAVMVTLVSFGIAASSPTGGTVFFPWYIGLIGLIFGIRGAVALSKAKKALGETAVGGMAGAYGNAPASSAPMPQAGPGTQQQMPAQPPATGQPQPGGQRDDDGQRSLGDLYR